MYGYSKGVTVQVRRSTNKRRSSLSLDERTKRNEMGRSSYTLVLSRLTVLYNVHQVEGGDAMHDTTT